jgi:hypothetical protein
MSDQRHHHFLPDNREGRRMNGIPPLPSDVLRRVRKRPGRCYELAFRVVFENPDDMDLLLVHGRARFLDFELPFDHAWVVQGDKVYDPVMDIWMPEVVHDRDWAAVPEAVYSKVQAARLLSMTKRYDPWTAAEHKAAEDRAGTSHSSA